MSNTGSETTVRIPSRIEKLLRDRGVLDTRAHKDVTYERISSVVTLTGPTEQLCSIGQMLHAIADLIDSKDLLVRETNDCNQHLIRDVACRFPAIHSDQPDQRPIKRPRRGHIALIRPDRSHTAADSARVVVTITNAATGTEVGTYKLPTKTAGGIHDATGALLTLGWSTASPPRVDREGRVSVAVKPADTLVGTTDRDNPTAVRAVAALSADGWHGARIPLDAASDWGNVPGIRGFVVEPIEPGRITVVDAKDPEEPDRIRGYASTLSNAGWHLVRVTRLSVEACSPGH